MDPDRQTPILALVLTALVFAALVGSLFYLMHAQRSRDEDDAARLKIESLRGLEQERQYWKDRAAFEMEHAETDYARWKHVPVDRVDKAGLEKWKERTQKHLQSHLADLDRQKARIEEQHGE